VELDRIKIKEHFKGIDRDALTRALNSSRNTIDQIAGGFIRVGPHRALEIERLTNGHVKASDLRPDIFSE